MKPLRLSEVKTPGWYINVWCNEIKAGPDMLFTLRYRVNEMHIYEFDVDGVWRSTTGHGVTLEQPNFFTEEQDLFFGPIDFEGISG